MSPPRFPLRLEPWRLAVCRFPADAPLPAWVFHESPTFWSLTRTPDELSLVCPEDDLPPSVQEHVERGWRAFGLVGPVPFTTTGVIHALTEPLAKAGVPVFVLSTFDTDWLLVRETVFDRALEVLRQHYEVRES